MAKPNTTVTFVAENMNELIGKIIDFLSAIKGFNYNEPQPAPQPAPQPMPQVVPGQEG